MAYISPEELRNASVDAGTLEKFTLGGVGESNVNRAGNDVSNLATIHDRALEIARQAANMQTYLTKAEADAAQPQPTGQPAQVTNDPDPANNGHWVSDGTQWVWSGVQPVDKTMLTQAVNAKLDRNESPVSGLLASVSDASGLATWLQARTLDGGPTDWAEQIMRDRLGLRAVSFPGVLAALVDSNGVFTDLELSETTGQISDRVMSLWAARIANLMPGIAGGKNYYVRGAEVLPTNADTASIAGWGSSTMGGLRDHMGSMATSLGASYYNGGVGSQMVRHIAARLGSVPALVTVTGGAIPASGPVGVTLSNVPYMSNLSYEGTLGGVLGTISASGGAYTFARSSAGDAVPIAADTPFLPTAGLQHRDSVTVLNMGKNDLTPGVPVSSRDLVIKYTSDSFDWLAPLNVRCIVMGHFVNRDDPVDSGRREHIKAVNAAYADRYGPLYFDLQGYLMSEQVWADTGLTPTAADLNNQGIGNLPPSLAADSQHLNAAAGAAVVAHLRKKFVSLGWYL